MISTTQWGSGTSLRGGRMDLEVPVLVYRSPSVVALLPRGALSLDEHTKKTFSVRRPGLGSRMPLQDAVTVSDLCLFAEE